MPDQPTRLIIESTDRKCLVQLIDYLNETAVAPDSTVIRVEDSTCHQCHGDGEIQVAGGQTDTCGVCDGSGIEPDCD